MTEDSPPDASYPYARSKRRGEDLVRQYSGWFPCSILRLAAVFSDWCEYPPLYVFLDTWLSHRWNRRILAGRGRSAVSYVHVFDLNRLLLGILRNSDMLPPLSVYLASPDGSTTHRDLYETATRCFHGRSSRPLLMPKPIALPGVVVRDAVGRLLGRRPFERAWMLRYADRRLEIDSSRTRSELGWQPTPRYHVARRMLFLLENMRGEPHTWHARNVAVLDRRLKRPNLAIYDALAEMRGPLVGEIAQRVATVVGDMGAHRYLTMDLKDLEWSAGVLYRLLMAAVRTGDRSLLLQYAGDLARRRSEEGFESAEVQGMFSMVEETVMRGLTRRPELAGFGSDIHHAVALSIQMAKDEIEDCFDSLAVPDQQTPSHAVASGAAALSRVELETIISRLEAFDRRWDAPPGSTASGSDDGSREA